MRAQTEPVNGVRNTRHKGATPEDAALAHVRPLKNQWMPSKGAASIRSDPKMWRAKARPPIST